MAALADAPIHTHTHTHTVAHLYIISQRLSLGRVLLELAACSSKRPKPLPPAPALPPALALAPALSLDPAPAAVVAGAAADRRRLVLGGGLGFAS